MRAPIAGRIVSSKERPALNGFLLELELLPLVFQALHRCTRADRIEFSINLTQQSMLFYAGNAFDCAACHNISDRLTTSA